MIEYAIAVLVLHISYLRRMENYRSQYVSGKFRENDIILHSESLRFLV